MAYGIVWGGLARQAGLSLGELVAMCLLVTAGTAQFVALPMIQSGAPAWLLVVTTYIVNLRHYLMAASLAPHFAHLSRGRLALLAHGVTDESYALTMARYAEHPPHPAYYAGSAATTYLAHPRPASIRPRLRVPGGVHRDPGANHPGPLAVGGGGRRRRRGARREGHARRDLAHRARRPGRLRARHLARAGRRRPRSRGRGGRAR